MNQELEQVISVPNEKGGYDCSFVEPPHHQLQTKCPVCLCILRDPYMIDCCGYSFCHTCIKTIQDHKNFCPLCNGQFTAYPDKRLFRTLKSMKVCCTHANSGCEWQGDLGDIDEHLNAGCIYENILCDYCNILIERRNLSHHQFEVCVKRPFSCDYCHEYESTFEDVTFNHWLDCPSRPVSCPNECGTYPEKRNLQCHLSNCQMALIKCQFSCFGCEAVVLRKDIQDHLMKDVVSHLSLQSNYYRTCFIQYDKKLKDCEEKIADLEKENAALKLTLQSVEEERRLNTSVNACTVNDFPTQYPLSRAATGNNCVRKLNDLESRLYFEELERLRSQLCVPPLQFTIHTVAKLQSDKTKWVSAPFYTHAQGYKMCLKVYPGGHSTSTDSHMSLFVCIMKGSYDSLLKWPFRGSIPLQLVDQLEDRDHINHCVNFSDDVSGEFSGQVVSSDLSGGWGILKFVSLDRLVPKYLQNDSILIRVNKALLS